MNLSGFSWKRLLGISAMKSRISRSIGVPLTRSGRQRKLGRGLGCLIPILLIMTLIFFGATPVPTKTLPNEHLKYGIPGTCSTCKTFYRAGYILCYDTTKNDSLWVAYHITKDYLTARKSAPTTNFCLTRTLPLTKGQRTRTTARAGTTKGTCARSRTRTGIRPQ